jgi:SAM-dependent methyltransferase
MKIPIRRSHLGAIPPDLGPQSGESDSLAAASAPRAAAVEAGAFPVGDNAGHNIVSNAPVRDPSESAKFEMMTRLSASTWHSLRCPACRSILHWDEELHCINEACGKQFPVVDRIPVLIDEERSLFDVNDFVYRKPTTWPPRHHITRLAVRFLPALSLNLRAERNIDRFAALLPCRQAKQRVLVIGGRSLGQGIKRLVSSDEIEIVETDVAFGPRTMLICDAHDLPFADGSFDGVIIQAVLQYVQEPSRVADEIHRVLADDGLVYAEVPFVQHGLEGYDYNRFPLLGLRRLFRRFEEISAGPVVGPASTLSWSLQFFFLSFVKGGIARAITKAAIRLAFFWVKYIDLILIGRPGAADAACELSFLGRKSASTLSDRALLRTHRKFW